MTSEIKLSPLIVVLSFLLSVSLWWSTSGTFAPYAATLTKPLYAGGCVPLRNLDDTLHNNVWTFLQGSEYLKDPVNTSIFKRILHPLLASPLLALFGFSVGGVLFNLLLNLAVGILFIRFCLRTFGERAAAVLTPLLATYTGWIYWATMPYSYGVVIPFSLLGFMVLWRFNNERSLQRSAGYALLLGILCLGYDPLLPFYLIALGVSAIMRWRDIPRYGIGVILLALPLTLWIGMLTLVWKVPMLGDNSMHYAAVLQGIINLGAVPGLIKLFTEMPPLVLHILFTSNFVILPYVGLSSIILSVVHHVRYKVSLVEASLLVSFLVLVVSLNLPESINAPWQLRGAQFSRYFQPILPVFLVMIARYMSLVGRENRFTAIYFIVVPVFIQVAIVLSPYLNLELASSFYNHFYTHGDKESYLINLARYGLRPLGFGPGCVIE